MGLKLKVADKRKPSYSLQKVKQLIREEKIDTEPLTVKQSTNGMCLTVFEAYHEILKLENKDFYKSVTQLNNNKVWQDVYKQKVKGIPTYIKFKIVGDMFLLLSFKPDTSKKGV